MQRNPLLVTLLVSSLLLQACASAVPNAQRLGTTVVTDPNRDEETRLADYCRTLAQMRGANSEAYRDECDEVEISQAAPVGERPAGLAPVDEEALSEPELQGGEWWQRPGNVVVSLLAVAIPVVLGYVVIRSLDEDLN
jgi:hypothetical protein